MMLLCAELCPCMTVLCICAWVSSLYSPQRYAVFLAVTWLLLSCSCGLINREVLPKAKGLFYLSCGGDALLPTSTEPLQSSPSLCLFYKGRIPHIPRDRQTVAEESRGGDVVNHSHLGHFPQWAGLREHSGYTECLPCLDYPPLSLKGL